MISVLHRISTAAVAGSILAVFCAGVHAQPYPSRPIRVIVPFPAGGNVDVFSRVLFRQVEIEIGGTFVIDKAGIVRWSVINAPGEARSAHEYTAVLAGL